MNCLGTKQYAAQHTAVSSHHGSKTTATASFFAEYCISLWAQSFSTFVESTSLFFLVTSAKLYPILCRASTETFRPSLRQSTTNLSTRRACDLRLDSFKASKCFFSRLWNTRKSWNASSFIPTTANSTQLWSTTTSSPPRFGWTTYSLSIWS